MSANSVILIASSTGAVIVGVVCFVVFLLRKRKRERRLILLEIERVIDDAFEEISSYFKYSHYITESERIYLEGKYSELYRKIRKVLESKELEKSEKRDCILRFAKAFSNTVGFKKENNRHFVESQLETYKDYFDNILSNPLDQQQREAVVTLEDNVLVISSAGSGKTMTTVAKVKYLIDVQKVPAEKILLITFTRKAAESLSKRLGIPGLKCRTFHKLALEIISEATGKKPTIVPADFSLQVYEKLFQERSSFRMAIADYIIRSRYKMKNQFEYDSRKDYMQARKELGVNALYADMDGHPVFCKSDEESQICDFLGSRGIKFRYEEKYEYDVADEKHRQYRPDFSIYIDKPDGGVKRVYLEHFAVNKDGHCPSWFEEGEEEKYIAGIAWKRNLHRVKGTVLLETNSAGFHRGDVFKMLEKDLNKLGVTFNDRFLGEISHSLIEQEKSILDMLTSFNFLLKSGNHTLDEIEQQAFGNERMTIKELVIPYIQAYLQKERDEDEIDFTDAIIEATILCNNGCRPDYDYILVDEFQDISIDRYKFLQSLRQKNPLTKLFCVGDDWQSIYRFAGSDMALFKHFSTYFGYTKTCLMETTYRFGEPAIHKTSNFILENPTQAVKHVKAFSAEARTLLDFVGYSGKESVAGHVIDLLETIPKDKSVMLLGRYNFDVNVFNGTACDVKVTKDKTYVQCGSRLVQFMTVHQSKGLESDYIILLNCNEGALGFPADIADDPVLKYVLSEPDQFAYSEERRVFYVAITRAKKHTYVLYDLKKPSPFVREFLQLNKHYNESDVIPENELCPKCRCGRIIVVKRGISSTGNPYSVQVCSNEKYGCDYMETVFVNLHPKKTYRRKFE